MFYQHKHCQVYMYLENVMYCMKEGDAIFLMINMIP